MTSAGGASDRIEVVGTLHKEQIRSDVHDLHATLFFQSPVLQEGEGRRQTDRQPIRPFFFGRAAVYVRVSVSNTRSAESDQWSHLNPKRDLPVQG